MLVPAIQLGVIAWILQPWARRVLVVALALVFSVCAFVAEDLTGYLIPHILVMGWLAGRLDRTLRAERDVLRSTPARA